MKLLSPRALVLCIGLAALVGCGKKPPPPPPPPVGIVTAEAQSVPLDKPLVGRLSSYLSANVTARVSGVLVRRVYTEGQEVKRGQLLFEIDPAFYQAQLKLALGTLAADQATLIDNHLIAERNHKLLPTGFVSQQNVDDADAAEHNSAGKVAADQATVAAARVNLGYTRVTSPIDGVASQQQVTVGAVVGSDTADAGAGGTLLTTVQKIDPLYVNFTISAADLLAMRQAQSKGAVALAQQDKTTAQIVLPNGAAYDQLAILDFSDVIVNPTTGAVNLRALVPNPQHVLSPGMYVTMTVDLGQENNVFLIPQQALQRDTIGAYLLTVDRGGKVVRKDVEAIDSQGADWIVTSGLANGDRVIVSGLQGVHEGGEAQASPWQAPAAAPPPGGQPAGYGR
ncbi:MAG TPA: efflux RND transporter periplasmic adaptor subunit [Caulobacteraceae bacterium]|nr:efflux RND transporter periplasmic adaptor subunit [Caulobacteraceae bacterium]